MPLETARFAPTYQISGQSGVENERARLREQWVVHVVRHVRGECPVVRAVFEQIAQRHGCVREPVHEQRLQDTLGVVAGPAEGGNPGKKEILKKMITFSGDNFISNVFVLMIVL